MNIPKALGLLLSITTTIAAVREAAAESRTLDKIRSRGVLAFGYRESSIPFSYLGEGQQPVGFPTISAWRSPIR